MNPELLSLIGIILSVFVFVYGVFKGIHIVASTLLGVVIVALFSGANIMQSITKVWAPKFGGTCQAYFLIFFFSALFARALGDTGAANAIAFKLAKLSRMWPGHEKLMAVLCVAIMQSVFTYFGVSVFVVTFTVMYIAKELFTELDVPWRLYTCGALGTSTFTTGMLPGSPQLTNLIPMEYFGTDPTAAPVLGIVCSLVVIAFGLWWINFSVKKAEAKNEGFLPSGEALLASWDESKNVKAVDLPLWKCLVGPIVLFIVMNVIKLDPIIAMLAGTVATYLVFNPIKQKDKIKPSIFTSISNAAGPLIALAAASGFGGVVAAAPGFGYVISALESIPGPPAIQVAVSVNVAAAFSASSSTGLRLTLDMLAERFMSTGIPAAALHRLSSIVSVCLDDLPHSPGLANAYYLTKISYKDGYINNFMISIVGTFITMAVAIVLISLGLTF